MLKTNRQAVNNSNYTRQNQDFLVEKLVNGTLRFHELPQNLTEREKVEIRRKALEKITGEKLDNIGNYSFNPEVAGKKNCENLIGGVQIPLGIAGPLKINGQYNKIKAGQYYIPLATTEGALVASINRGCKAINLGGGVKTQVKDVGITRAPVFKCKVKSAKCKTKIIKWLKVNFNKIAEVCEGTSKHLRLIKIEPFWEKEAVFLRFSFETGLAMGMNMATIACAKASQLIEKETGAKLVALSGNVCCDKKAAKLNFEKGRGKQVKAEAILTDKILKDILKTNAHDFYEVYRLKIVLGSKIAGTVSANAQVANVLAAIFTACGQDIAHISEASIGETKCRLVKGGGIKISVWLPDLPIGVIGGGTGLETQKEALGILNLNKQERNDHLNLGEIIGGAVLAGEISLIAALASGDLAKAHEKLGRQQHTKI